VRSIVTSVSRRLRSLLIALAVLALSAGVALAGRSAHSAPPRPDQATQVEGSGNEQGDVDASEPSEGPETEASEPPENEPISGTEGTDTATGVHPDNHGKLVSEAAQGATPSDSDNHGQYVRTIAQANHGQTTSTTAKSKAPSNH
jgi:hypothetical protein